MGIHVRNGMRKTTAMMAGYRVRVELGRCKPETMTVVPFPAAGRGSALDGDFDPAMRSFHANSG